MSGREADLSSLVPENRSGSRNPYKQGKFTPGTHIPILDPARIRETKPDYIFIPQ